MKYSEFPKHNLKTREDITCKTLICNKLRNSIINLLYYREPVRATLLQQPSLCKVIHGNLVGLYLRRLPKLFKSKLGNTKLLVLYLSPLHVLLVLSTKYSKYWTTHVPHRLSLICTRGYVRGLCRKRPKRGVTGMFFENANFTQVVIDRKYTAELTSLPTRGSRPWFPSESHSWETGQSSPPPLNVLPYS